MISCKRATELISKRMEEPLTISEELALRVHLFICECCEKFKQQVELLRNAFSSVERDLPENVTPPDGAKQRLKDRLNLD